MIRYAQCLQTGEVIGRGTLPDATALTDQTPLRDDDYFVEVDEATYEAIGNPGNQSHRVVGEKVVPRLLMPVLINTAIIPADGETKAHITGIPEGAMLTISGAVKWGPGEIAGGNVDLSSRVAGVIRIQLDRSPHFRPWSATIHAT